MTIVDVDMSSIYAFNVFYLIRLINAIFFFDMCYVEELIFVQVPVGFLELLFSMINWLEETDRSTNENYLGTKNSN